MCYTCKTTGHTAQTCKRFVDDNIETPLSTFPPSKNIETNTSLIDLATPPIGSDQSTIQDNIPHTNRTTNEEPLLPKIPPISNIDINHKTTEANTLELHIKSPHQTTINTEQIFQTEQTGIQYKRAISDTSSQMSPPTTPSPIATQQPQSKIKKPKVRSQSNSSTINDDDTPDDPLNPAQTLFSDARSWPITYTQFKYIIEISTNKSVRIPSVCKDANIKMCTLMALIDKTYPMITNSRMKSKLSKFRNLLFQITPIEQET